MKTLRYITLLTAFFAFVAMQAEDVENEFQSRTNLEMSYKVADKLKVSFSPELRWDDSFSIDEYHLDLGVEYKLLDYLSVQAQYNFIANLRETKDTEYFGRYNLSAIVSEKFGRFTPSFRLLYSNYADDDDNDKSSYLKYKAGLKYNIKDCKITPYAAMQFYHDLDEQEIRKIRYSAGASYKLNKKNYIKLGYKMDYFMTKSLNRHIVEVGYKYKF